MDKGEFNRWLFEVMNTVTLVAERRGRILGFLYATLEETSPRIVFLAVLPEYRRRGIGTALHQELKVHIPREVAFVGAGQWNASGLAVRRPLDAPPLHPPSEAPVRPQVLEPTDRSSEESGA